LDTKPDPRNPQIVKVIEPETLAARTGYASPHTVHTLGYLTVTAAAALVVYQTFGLAMLRRSWFNLDLQWAIALIVTGFVALLV
jgi:hypothetical protein